MIKAFVGYVGRYVLDICSSVGLFAIFLGKVFTALVTTKPKIRQVLLQMERIGVQSFSIIFLTGLSSGFALALQSHTGLAKFGGDEFIGVIVALGMTREVAPVLTGIMVTGRSGSSIAAELGTMKVTEQIDALTTLCINPYQFLIIPRIIASVLILPILAMISMLCGIIGGYLYSTHLLLYNPDLFISSIRSHILASDIAGGLLKAAVFGFIISSVGSFMGHATTGGASGVGRATTQSVVVGSITILIINYILSSLLF